MVLLASLLLRVLLPLQMPHQRRQQMPLARPE
jgi:hypothetical protein